MLLLDIRVLQNVDRLDSSATSLKLFEDKDFESRNTYFAIQLSVVIL